MPDSKFLSMLGLARRAGRLSMGHDTAQQAVIKNRAKLIILSSDASERLVKEFKELAQKYSPDTEITVIKPTMDEIHFALGSRAGVMSVDDENFASRLISLSEQEDIVYGN